MEVIVVEDDPGGPAGSEPDSADKPTAPQKRILGSLRGLLHVPDNFDEPLPDDILRVFEGDE